MDGLKTSSGNNRAATFGGFESKTSFAATSDAMPLAPWDDRVLRPRAGAAHTTHARRARVATGTSSPPGHGRADLGRVDRLTVEVVVLMSGTGTKTL